MSGYCSLPLEEQETCISWSRTEKTAHVYTSDKTIMTKLDNMCKRSPENYKLLRADTVGGFVCSKDYVIADKKLITLRASKVIRELTEEQRRAIGENLKQARQ